MSRLSELPVLVLVLSFAAGCGGTTFAPGPSAANPLDSEESALVYELNRLRGDNGVAGTVSVCKSLNEAASAHSDDMRDNHYLNDKSLAGKTARERDCDASYKPACSNSTAMAELVASGLAEGKATLDQWRDDASTKEILLNPDLVFAGVGRALGDLDEDPSAITWSLDLGAVDDPSCK